MKICSFNVNSVRARIENIVNWLKEENPDIVLLQELKCQDEQFPREFFEELGYNIETFGQKSWNGVAVLSKFAIEDVVRGIPNFEDANSRYLEVFTGGIRVASTYMPNGNPIATPKFDYKLNWMKAMTEHFETLKSYDEPVIIAGDFNVVPTDNDANKSKTWFKNEACTQKEVRDYFFKWVESGWTDALRFLKPEEIYYTYWDYFKGGLENNRGVLLDYFFLNKQAKKMLKNGGVDKEPRLKSKPSDHAPIWIEI